MTNPVPAAGLPPAVQAQPAADQAQPAADQAPAAPAPSLAEGYRQYFEVVPATSDPLREHSYRIRHEVYCRELGFEPLCANGMEQDADDNRSLHFLIRAVASQAFVGCARLILADGPEPLPFERACAGSLQDGALDPARLDRRRIAEVSRLAIVGHYRRRQGEGRSPVAVNDIGLEGARVRLPYLTLGLYLGLMALARWRRLEHLYILTEPALARSLGRLGVDLVAIGSPIRHRGERTPYVLQVERVLAGLNGPVRELYETIAAEMQPALEPQG